MKQYDVIIVGAGASGICSAISASRKEKKILLIDRLDKMGKKILVTGNGKCNLTNKYQEKECYRSDAPEKAWEIIQQFDEQDTMTMMQDLGLFLKSRNGYVYPYNEQAAAVREVFESFIANRPQITFQGQTEVNSVEKKKKHFLVKTTQGEFCATKIIVATGGMVSSKLGCDGSGYKIAKAFGHKIIKPLPALTPLKSAAPFLKKISGVRNQAEISLYAEDTLLTKERGELQWTDYGISGVAIFQISRYAITEMEQGKQVKLLLDFAPDYTKEELYRQLEEMSKHCRYKTMQELLRGILPAKLVPVVLREARIEERMPVKKASGVWTDKLVKAMKEFCLRIQGYQGFEKAQATRGGVPLTELTDTLESTKCPGLFFAGEVVDVDGTCGGYNLQWAFASGTIAGQATSKNDGK